MNTRYRITRSPQGDQVEKGMSLEECKIFFAQQADFVHAEEYSSRSGETVMKIKGEFFMWQLGEVQIPFRYFDGDVYVSVSHEVIYHRMLEVAEGLHAQCIEG
ncbi:hypothetical protein [Paenibacillus endoradicis]|uniref:hypothetical protein n=1 Tax=Paenibacillus endoradicis TaxID=2972487 RepID=UPI002158C2A1|nr:hypothetical protein [Paenibacillus endoradicis]MCR8659771.1 hypothetical protein [Paenibacillus endoradicis]